MYTAIPNFRTLPTAICNGNRYTFNISYPDDNKVVLTASDVQLALNKNTISEQSIWLYPNPANSLVTLRNDSGHVFIEIALFDINGRKVQTVETSELTRDTEINLDNIPSGVYFVKIKSENASLTKRILKN